MIGIPMKITMRRIPTILIFTFMALALLACDSGTAAVPGSIESPQAAYSAAQSTLVAGQSQMDELSHQAAVVGLNMAQAANAAEQATLDYNQRQMMELSYQRTAVSQNMARAAATQQSITKQTQMAWNATATAQSSAATATYSASVLNATQTAQAQAILDLQVTQTAQANATQTAYSLTATPWAAILAANLRTQKRADLRAWWGEFVVTPLIFILLTLALLTLAVVSVMVYRRLIPALEHRRLTISQGNENESPMLLLDGMIVDPNPPRRQLTQPGFSLLNQPQFPSDKAVQVEIIGASEPSVTNWITEAEQKLRSDGGIQP
jgi:hypothetical protein